jgi:hypothetical protein
MSDTDKPSTNTMLLTIAWAQFLAMAAAVDKNDMHAVSLADLLGGIRSLLVWQWDWTKFGGLAVALNVLAICLLTFPALFDYSPWDLFPGKPRSARQFLTLLRNLGFYAWLFSFVTFACYLNRASVYAVWGTFFFFICAGVYFRYVNSETDD